MSRSTPLELPSCMDLHLTIWVAGNVLHKIPSSRLPVGRYVSGKDADANVVYVSRQYYELDKKRDSFRCSDFSWTSDMRPLPCQPFFCKVRHGPTLYRWALHGACTLVDDCCCSSCASITLV